MGLWLLIWTKNKAEWEGAGAGKKKPVGFIWTLSAPLHSKVFV